jgi:hypothetical protein
VSKERARRRAERERELAIRTAARAAEAERRERRAARRAVVRRVAGGRLPRVTPAGRPTGTLARRRRIRTSLVLMSLLAVNVLVWVVRPDWAARLAVAVVTVLVAPVLVSLLARPRR